MPRSIVTSENKQEYDQAHMERRAREYAKDMAAAQKASQEAKDEMSHDRARRAHLQASIYAHPPENIEKHLAEARRHEKEAKKHGSKEKREYVKTKMQNRAEAHKKLLREKGVVASTGYET